MQLAHQITGERGQFQTRPNVRRRYVDALVAPARPTISAGVERENPGDLLDLPCGLSALCMLAVIEAERDAGLCDRDHVRYILVRVV